MIDPFPDETALQPFMGFNRIPVFLEVAATVAHGVGKLAHDDRPWIVAGGGMFD